MTSAPNDPDELSRLRSAHARMSEQNARLERERRELAEVAEELDLAVLVVDRDQKVVQQLIGPRHPAEADHSDLCDVLDRIGLTVDVPVLRAQVADVLHGGMSREVELRTHDGRWRRIHLRPHRATTSPCASVAVVDIDSLKHRVSAATDAAIEAQRTSQVRDEFLSLVSHELRTPLASVLMNAQLLRQGEFAEVDAGRAIAAIERGTRAQLHIIDELLDAARIVAGGLVLECDACDVVGLIHEAIEIVRPSSERKRVAIECELDATAGPIWGDATHIRKVIASILDNAIKFTDPGRHVRVALASAGDAVELCVRDEGCGVDPEFLPHVFDRLLQQDNSRQRKHGGLGLSLAIAQHVVTSCGGTLTVESHGRGTGATFMVRFPRANQASADDDDRSPHASPLERPGRTRRYAMLKGLSILVVDDDAATRDAIVEVLALSGADVRSAESATEAMTVLERFGPKVIVSDIAMPGEDGYSFIRRVRKLGEHGRKVRAIALTALSTQTDRWRARAAGFDAHVPKPVDIDRLRDAVAEVLER